MNIITSDSPLFQRGEGKSPEPYVVDESNVVQRFFPKTVNLTLPGHTVRKFGAGFQMVPAELVDHPWLKANGMIEPKSTDQLPLQPQAPLGSQGFATAFAQSGVYDATMVPSPVVTDESLRSADAMARIAAENVKIARENLDNALRVHQNSVAVLGDAVVRREQSDSDDREDRAQGGGRQVRETAKDRRAREKREEDFYDTLSDEDKVRWDDSTQDQRNSWLAQGPKS